MNRTIEFTDNAWDDYIYWQTQDKKVLKRINALIKECLRTPLKEQESPNHLRRTFQAFGVEG